MSSKRLSLGVSESESTACCLDSSATEQKFRAALDRAEPRLAAAPKIREDTDTWPSLLIKSLNCLGRGTFLRDA